MYRTVPNQPILIVEVSLRAQTSSPDTQRGLHAAVRGGPIPYIYPLGASHLGSLDLEQPTPVLVLVSFSLNYCSWKWNAVSINLFLLFLFVCAPRMSEQRNDV